MVHPSHFFEPVEGFIKMNPGKVQVAVLNGLVRNAGCPEYEIDAVVNGAIADIIQNIIAPKQRIVKVTDVYGNIIPDNRVNPTKDELVDSIIEKFEGITCQRATQLIDFLLQNGVLTSDSATDKLYLQTPSHPRQLVKL